MTITKFPQSCLKIEKAGEAILVDVGTLATAKYKVQDFGKFEAVLYTHSHGDHLDVSAVGDLCANGASCYGNQDVADKVDGNVEVIEDGEELVVAGFKVKAFNMEHCLMVDGEPAGIPNTGLLIDDRLLLPGDSTEDTGIVAEIVALPIFGPDISFKDAFVMLNNLKAKTAIPVHYDVTGMSPESFIKLEDAARGGHERIKAEVKVLGDGESVEL